MPTHGTAQNDTQTGYTILFTDVNYLAVSNSLGLYIELTEQQYQSCKISLHFNCEYLISLQDRSKESCLMALFTDQAKLAFKICDYRFFPTIPEARIIQVTRAAFLVTSEEKVEIQCPTDRTLLPPAPLRIIKMPCQCTMATGNLYLPAVMTACNGTTVMMALNVVNLAQVLAYDMVHALPNAVAHPYALSNSTPIIQVPSLTLLSNVTQKAALDSKMGINLQEAVDQAMHEHVKLHEDTIVEHYSSFTDMPWEYACILSASLIWLTGLSVLFVWLGYKYRCLFLIVATLRGTDISLT